MDKHFEYEKIYKSRPHLVLMGAGASVAAIPNGDKNGMKTSVMDGFIEKLGMSEIISDLKLETDSNNLEDIYAEIAGKPEYKNIRGKLDSSIRNYFSSFEIPDSPTVYDYLLLSLREKDLVATFNWDPLLLQAYQRVSKITSKLPDLAFLHGNVLVGYCLDHKHGGNLDNFCPECGKPFRPSRLLYPITQKNYNDDLFTADNWKALKNYLSKAYLVTIFGYSAPKTDVEAVDILKEAWGGATERNMEDFEFIDIQDEDALISTWSEFVHTHHYSYTTNFFESSLAKFPRRTTEELFDRTQNCHWTSSKNPFTQSMTFSDLRNIVGNLVLEEEKHRDGFITLLSEPYNKEQESNQEIVKNGEEVVKIDFTLEIYEPEDDRCIAAVFHSDKPFMNFSKGDYINSTTFPEAGFHGLLEITSVEHIIWEIENSHQTHKVCVRTKKANL